ncbi:BRCT domain-containing protein [Lactiplantibacillus plantarum]|uniref:BRCT domain-containing protein n=2 Tax=Lactiplantibacillus plantarum TaxID=1590 RepID=A0AAW3RFH9_LACPN|nr:BRCT domain-containing protein [Lactiplantibacillus plantarum]AOB21317.1 hypothetical protein AVR82_16980 [Lactiplantibacillus plantarum]AOB24651.1 hypothetical protein AVR83_16990 [Lactiplantibacillus plantarum]AOB24701.1 hypothetical protein AVR83_17275 [Lactiplantibacillus plantarum]ERO39989.1 hypothetical protein LPLWJ_29330 [Lactiplantibacillus plantarum WJL]KPN44536.1 hypothetical protein WJL_0051 [Lactiplantibacillus plantarum WJL]
MNQLTRAIRIEEQCVLFTGRLNTFTRKAAQQLVIDAGGKVLNYCSQAVTLLVVGVIDKGLFEELTTRKLVWAQSKSIAIIGEAEFIQLIKRNI